MRRLSLPSVSVTSLLTAAVRSLPVRYFGGLCAIGRMPERRDAGAGGFGPRDDQAPLRWDDPIWPYAPGGVFDPLFAGLLVDAAGIRAATLGRFGPPYPRFKAPCTDGLVNLLARANW